MKFDAVVGNPPYQQMDGGNAASATPIYHHFVEQAKGLDPQLLSMIIPARWFGGGRGLDTFRSAMLHDNQLCVIHDFVNAADCFPGVEIKGGVCYFLWQQGHEGPCLVHSHQGSRESSALRPLLEPGMETFIRNDIQLSVLRKVRRKGGISFTRWLHAGRYFGFHTKVEWDEKGGQGRIQTADGKSFIPVYAAKRRRDDVKIYVHGGVCWVARSQVPRHPEAIDCYKVLLPRSGNPGGSILGRPRLSEPGSCSSNTYVVAVPPAGKLSQDQAQKVLSYLKTKFVRFLIAAKTSTQDMPPRAYDFVPAQDFSQTWTDEKLYQTYGLTAREIQEIERLIPIMED